MSFLQKAINYFKPTEQKSSYSYSSFVNYLSDSGHSDLSDFVSIDLYSKVAPLATAVAMVADEVAALLPIVKDKDGEIVENHPVLDLLANPNNDQTKTEYFKRFAAYFIITGDNYQVALGQVNKPPIEIAIPSPQAINTSEDDLGEVAAYRVTKKSGAFTFIREENGSRYYDGPLRELWHSKMFNPLQDAVRGQSVLTPIWYEIEQYKQSSIHNLSLLKRGARPSGVFTAKESLTDDQYQRLKEQVDKYFTGSNNAGRPLLADGGELEWNDTMLSQRDLDFIEMRKSVTVAIFNQLKIPLPLVSPDTQTFNNMQASNLQLFDNAVMPLADRIYEEMTLFLLPRYKGSEDMRITYDKSKIEALDVRKTNTLESRSKMGIYTINELRNIDGMEPVDGGDEVLRPGTEVPVATDTFTEDQLDKPATRAKFFDIMKKNTDLDDEELNAIANKHGLN